MPALRPLSTMMNTTHSHMEENTKKDANRTAVNYDCMKDSNYWEDELVDWNQSIEEEKEVTGWNEAIEEDADWNEAIASIKEVVTDWNEGVTDREKKENIDLEEEFTSWNIAMTAIKEELTDFDKEITGLEERLKIGKGNIDGKEEITGVNRWLSNLGKKGTVDLNVRLPFGKKLHLNATENFSFRTCLNYLAYSSVFEMKCLIFVYINDDVCSLEDFNSPLKNIDFGLDAYVHITTDESDVSKTMTEDFAKKEYDYEIIMDHNTYVKEDLVFETVLKGDVRISN